MQFLSVKKWCSANAFPDTKQKHVYWKICKVRKIFDWLLRLRARKSEIKKNSDDVQRNVGMNIKSCMPEIIFSKKKKKISKYEIFNHLHFGPTFVFWGLLYGVFVGVLFQFFDVYHPWWKTFSLSHSELLYSFVQNF